MKIPPVRNIVFLLVSLLFSLAMASCIYDSSEAVVDEDSGEAQLILRIKALDARSSSQASELNETVKSLRIIIIDNNGKLEINEKISLPGIEYKATDFSYTYINTLTSGKKKLYLVANEESVGAVSLTDMSGIPAGMPSDDFSDLLDYFEQESEDHVVYIGNTLETVLNRVYYKNDYSAITDGDKIYLPYTSFYEFTIRGKEMAKEEKKLFLVPVAAKFDFVFVNYRREDAQIEEIVISSLNSHNYLNAQLKEEEKNRSLDDKSLWWIDWLQACAEGSQSASDTGAYNNLWGWIKDYFLPVPDEDRIDKSLVPESGTTWIIDALVDKANPSKLSLGPYYVPESVNIVQDPPADEDEMQTADVTTSGSVSQTYTLSFRLHDADDDEIITLSGYPIDTLHALFRATHVIVTIELYESEVEIYAEIAPWEPRRFLGFVQQDDDD